MSALSFDHVIIGVADLEAAAAALGRVLGRTPSWRGRHPTYGTANVLFRLDSAYVELLAPDPAATTDGAWTGSLGRFLNETGGGLFSVALATPDVAETAAAARARGLAVEEPAEGEGVDLDTGAVRRWCNARIPPEATRGTRTLFIEHRSPADALPPAGLSAAPESAASDVLAVTIESEYVEGARRLWRELFALPEALWPERVEGLRPERVEGAYGEGWRYDLGNANLILRAGTVEGPQPDRWALLVCRVADLAGAAERLGVDYERAEYGGAPGLLVSVCGASLFLTEAI